MDVLLLFIKNPELGKAKTRIAKDLGDEAALAIYEELLEEMRLITAATPVRRQLWYSSFVDENDGWDADMFEKKRQKGNDLGERLENAFNDAFEQGAQKAVVIGSDCPYFSADDLLYAFEALEKTDAVVGPTFDGGYYLLGMKQFLPGVFKDIAWSTETVFEETLKQLGAAGLSCTVLKKLHDIDHAEDYDAWLRHRTANAQKNA